MVNANGVVVQDLQEVLNDLICCLPATASQSQAGFALSGAGPPLPAPRRRLEAAGAVDGEGAGPDEP
eukprot:2572716-Amphidinium_carterae.1